MSDLISRQLLKDWITGHCDIELHKDLEDLIVRVIDDQPTAYDVDKVVEQLQQMKTRYFLTIANTGNETLDKIYEDVGNSIDKAISIVKGGGQGE